MNDSSRKEKRCSAEELLNLPNGIINLILRGIRPPDMDYDQFKAYKRKLRDMMELQKQGLLVRKPDGKKKNEGISI